jgi:predicted dehydrogenase
MALTKLKTAVVGVDEAGQALLDGLLRLGDIFELSAVADASIDAANPVARKHQVSGYDDLRQMLIQKDLDVIVSSGPLHASVDHLHAAMKKGCHILRCPPSARSYGEAAELFKTADAANVLYAVARSWRYRQAARSMRSYLEKHADEQFYLVEAWCSSSAQPAQVWQKDPQLAGGGVVLYLSYPLIDQIRSIFGMPQQVYALCTNQAPDRKQRRALTEDTAIVTMRFDDRLIGKLIAGRTARPEGWLIRVYGRNSQVSLSEKGFTARNSDGDVLEEVPAGETPESLIDTTLRYFGMAIVQEDFRPFESEPSEIMGNMAIIQAAYLSDRTGMPEEPARIASITKA